jgi:putative ABC transport system permease protein
MFVPLLVLRNAFRHKLRTTLTVVGIIVAITAFGLLRTIVDAWYAGANASSAARLVTRSSVSLVFLLPLNYAQKIRQVPGVESVAWANWFGGVYIDERNFFAQFAISPSYLDLYPEFVLKDAERKAFLADRVGALAGRKLADKYGWKVGDQIPLRGTIYPGTWTFTLRGIYDGADEGTDTSTFFIHFDYLNEAIKRQFPRRADQAGVFIEQLHDPEEAAAVSAAIDATFKNSLAETLTETEKAFQLGFVAMSEAILLAIQAVSYVVIVIIMAVMANTMAMTARERYGEYATFKALGFGNGFVAMLIFAESIGIAVLGGLLGIAFTFPMAEAFASSVGSILSGFHVSEETVGM